MAESCTQEVAVTESVTEEAAETIAEEVAEEAAATIAEKAAETVLVPLLQSSILNRYTRSPSLIVC